MNSIIHIHIVDSNKFVSKEIREGAIQRNQLEIYHKLKRTRSKGNVDIPGR
jgi:hypothetical protein